MGWRNLSKTAEKSFSIPRAAGVFLFMISCKGKQGMDWEKVHTLSWHTFQEFLGILAYKRGGLQR
jgi:hypothetical protein